MKFSHAELVDPVPHHDWQRGLASGHAELTDRETGETAQIPLDEIVEHTREALA